MEIEGLSGAADSSTADGVGDGAVRCAYFTSACALQGFTLTDSHPRTKGEMSHGAFYGTTRGTGGFLADSIVSNNYGSVAGLYCGTAVRTLFAENHSDGTATAVAIRFSIAANCIFRDNDTSRNSHNDTRLYNCTVCEKKLTEQTVFAASGVRLYNNIYSVAKNVTAGAVGCAHGRAAALPSGDRKIRATLLHLGMNMWGGYALPGERRDPGRSYARTVCPTDRKVWDAAVGQMRQCGHNVAFVDLGGGVEFPSHPELNVRGCWTAQALRDEVVRLRDMGIVAVPKLNFSACHDAWLGPYERMVSTSRYYGVVRDVIADACEIFGNPALVHVGMDEEDLEHQRRFPCVTIRQGDLWWHDLFFYFDELERHGARPVVFGSGMARKMGEAFYRRMPRRAIQNFGMYGSGHTLAGLRAKYEKDPSSHNEMYLKSFGLFRQMAEHGFEILSCTSNWKYYGKSTPKSGKDFPRNRESIAWLHDHAAREIADPKLFLGGIYMPWEPLDEKSRDYTLEGIRQLAEAMEAHGWKA